MGSPKMTGNEPIFISTWVLGAFHISPVILTLVLVVLDIVLYAPFVILNQKQERAEQAALVSAE